MRLLSGECQNYIAHRVRLFAQAQVDEAGAGRRGLIERKAPVFQASCRGMPGADLMDAHQHARRVPQ